MADVVLVFPKTGFDIRRMYLDLPLSLLWASSYVARDYEVKIIDQRTTPNWEDVLRKELEKEPICVGTSSFTGPQLLFALQASRIVREAGVRSKMVWGGVHATLLPEQTASDPLVDIVVVGDGEITFRNLVAALEKGRDLSDVSGLAFKNDGKVLRTPPQTPIDLNDLPELPYHLVDMNQYIGNIFQVFPRDTTRGLSFMSSRGCPWQCAYCANPPLSKRRWRSMTAERAYELVSKLVDKYKLDAINFHDEEFFVDKARSDELARLIGGKFQWAVQGRMDRLKVMDLPFLEKNGLVTVMPGIESGCERILRLIKKNETLEDYLEANRLLARTGIRPIYNFMMGFPTETRQEVMETVDFALRLLEENPNTEIGGFYVLAPYPGAELFDISVKEGFSPPDSLGGWAVYNRQHLNTPWIQDRLPLFKSIMLSSRFIDERRLRSRLQVAFQGLPAPLFICRPVGRFYRNRWRKHIFKPRLDSLVDRFFLSLFSLSQNRLFSWMNKRRRRQRRPDQEAAD